MLALSFAAIYHFKKISIDASNEFPEVNCESIENRLGKEELKQLAGLEYEQWMEYPEKSLNGALQCFCDSEAKSWALDWYKELRYQNNYKYGSQSKGTERENPICEKY